MIKKTIRLASYAAAVFGLTTMESCKKDDGDLCYKCTYDGDSETLCYEDYKDDFDSKSEFTEFIEYIEDYLDINCSKK